MSLEQEFNSLFSKKYLNAKDLNALIKRYKKTGGERKFILRDEIFYNVARFIRKRVNSHPLVSINERDDVFNMATIEFYTCLEKYKFQKGFSFTTYLGHWVKKAIYQHVQDINIITIGRGAFSNDNLRADALRACNNSLIYLDKNVKYEGWDGSEFQSEFQIEDIKALRKFNEIDDKQFDLFLRKNLTVRQYLIIRFRFLNEETWSLVDFKPVIGVNGEMARQLECGAMFRLRKILKGEDPGRSWYDHDKMLMPSDEFLSEYNLEVIKKHDEAKKRMSEAKKAHE